jgi:drug/metabolite transporter (DMT)-like permease
MASGSVPRQSSGISAVLASPYLLLTCAALFWSGNFVVGRALRGDIQPISLNFWRWTLALAILLAVSVEQLRRHHVLLRREWKTVLALGATGVAIFHSCVYLALTSTTAINALLYLATVPVMIVLVSWIVFRDTITFSQALGIIVSLLGALVMISRADIALLRSVRFNPGDLWMLAAVPAWAIYSVLLKRRPATLPHLTLLTATVIAGVLLLLPVYVWRLWSGEVMALNEHTILGLSYIVVFPSILAFIFWNKGVAGLGPNRAGMFIYFMPVFGAVLSVLFLGEQIAAFHVAGALLVFIGIMLVAWRPARPYVQPHVGPCP